MSKPRNQTVIIPADQVVPDEALVIEIPKTLRNKPVVIARAKEGSQTRNCCDATDYSMFLSNVQSSKSAPGIMAGGVYVSSYSQHEDQSISRPHPGTPPSHQMPTYSQTIAGSDRQCGNLTANIFMQTPKKQTAAITTSTESFGEFNKSKFFENLTKAIFTSPKPDDYQTLCMKCCEQEQNAPPSIPRSPSPPALISSTLTDDCGRYCSKERLEPPPAPICPPRPSAVPYKPSVPNTSLADSSKVHCSKCCALAAGNLPLTTGHFKCIPSSSHHRPPKDDAPSLLTVEELERIKTKFLEAKIKLSNLIKCTTPRQAQSANPIGCSGGQSFKNVATPVSSDTSGPCPICQDAVQGPSQHICRR
ncbi:unnamed protein product [Acanthoscelides obtectus]|uniref:Uncharacterized protein n=1 Tax=Acanthoscelides obtectus TaxID=200917 RepID=A0A9P0Q3R4_ACAOB|nr:unnamed protein product [Acanthoscelides obtectus]CAK1645251.1 hypothetical protein AOBTE_LOCUS14068 [Acanthoscelides obtectus]